MLLVVKAFSKMTHCEMPRLCHTPWLDGDVCEKQAGVFGTAICLAPGGSVCGAGMLHLRELQVLCSVCVVERDREVVGKLACC